MKKILNVLLAIFTILIFISCVSENDKLQSKEKKLNEEFKEKEDKIQILIDNMTLQEKIGQLLIVGFDGITLDDNIRNLIKNKCIGGVIFFGDNVNSLMEVINLINEFKDINKENKVPLFISVDEEGGVVSRVPQEFKKLPSAPYVASFNSKEICYKEGDIIANELKLKGYNMDYAPVLDILSNPQNTVIGNRAFGENAEIVSNLAVEVMRGIQDNGVISVVKHFPGHGDTSVDSHYGLPLVEKSLEELRQLEFIPFENAIKNGADAIMASHILLKNIDSENPATMSKIIISNILRESMEFKGVIITDDMTMGAITENYNIGEAAIKSIEAGVDIVLVCHGYDNEIEVITSIEEAIANGIISEERINESVYRILYLKNKYNLKNDNCSEVDNVEGINTKIDKLFD
ncbi:beta-N-acetylhexosaminidase [Clostridium sp. D53t1_180928_C8]|uniref:beta-N-acetylhexosaminidase n=1 Tax=Clostridium sp. D53t1_180928_C8 TaxID=2787101 RepID=UPI0018AA2B89|nr:beta-N-acetylhexosaminidase [Clostridium sp. D53t1_180928_C8]